MEQQLAEVNAREEKVRKQQEAEAQRLKDEEHRRKAEEERIQREKEETQRKAEEEEQKKARAWGVVDSKPRRFLSFLQWCAAIDKYILCAACVPPCV